MQRYHLFALGFVASLAAATSAFGSEHETERKAWYVIKDTNAEGVCYVSYQPRPPEELAGEYLSSEEAYKALESEPACAVTAEHLKSQRGG